MSNETQKLIINVGQPTLKTDVAKIRRIISFTEKSRPMNEIILSRIKELLQDAIDYEKENKTNFISNDFQLNRLIHCLLQKDNQNPVSQD